MIIDTSAIIAILRDEPDANRFIKAISQVGNPLMSAANLVEAAIVVDSNHDPVLSGRFDDLFTAANIGVEAVTQKQADIARRAYRDFGKGSGHPASLNFGDCFAYALARDKDEPLLFKGEDFKHTDIVSVF